MNAGFSADDGFVRAAPREFTITRVLAVPVEEVWAAWTDAERLARWWGPKGYTNPVCHIEPRVDGQIHIVMRAPDGSEYDNRGTVQAIDAPRLLTFTIELKNLDQSSRLINLTTVELAEHGEGTLLRVQVRVLRETAAAAPDITGMHTGWSQSLDRLAADAAPVPRPHP
jgi:uncharacterized protein YndB with AHSA1/START domain